MKRIPSDIDLQEPKRMQTSSQVGALLFNETKTDSIMGKTGMLSGQSLIKPIQTHVAVIGTKHKINQKERSGQPVRKSIDHGSSLYSSVSQHDGGIRIKDKFRNSIGSNDDLDSVRFPTASEMNV